MKRILFFIHDLGVGGAEKVLVNLVNHLNKELFDVTVVSLFGGGVNEQFLEPHIHYKCIWKKTFRGNSKILKFGSPRFLHRMFIKEKYDIEVAFLEGVVSRIISGCPNKETKLFSWIHIEQRERDRGTSSFRSYRESVRCYKQFAKIVCVSETVKECFQNNFPDVKEPIVRYNIVETDKILRLADTPLQSIIFNDNEINLVGVGKISRRKGFDKIARIICRLRKEGYPVHFYALGIGNARNEIEKYLVENHIENYYTFLGYQTNPYNYVKHSDLFICASVAEGFSTAATEALIVGTPVCTVKVSGMEELLGENEWGLITENSESALYDGIKRLLDNPDMLMNYREKAAQRGELFVTENLFKQIENLFI